MSDKYTWDNARDLKHLSMDQTRKNNRSDEEGMFHMVTLVFDNRNLSQENFAIYTWRAVMYALGLSRKHVLPIHRTIWRPVFRPTYIHNLFIFTSRDYQYIEDQNSLKASNINTMEYIN